MADKKKKKLRGSPVSEVSSALSVSVVRTVILCAAVLEAGLFAFISVSLIVCPLITPHINSHTKNDQG